MLPADTQTLSALMRRWTGLCNKVSSVRAKLYEGISSGADVEELRSEFSILQAESDSALLEVHAKIGQMRDELKRPIR
jgi:hypothetical protein